MLTEERKAIILYEVNEKGSVTLAELTEKLGVSESTVRRDIMELGAEGKLLRVRGGAMKLEDENVHEAASHTGKGIVEHKNDKIKIAEYAASLILPNEYVFIDAGVTTGYMISFLKETKAVYITNSVSHAAALVARRLRTFLIGGEMMENADVIVGPDAILHIQKYNFAKGFLGTSGIDTKLGFTTDDVREALIKRVAIEGTDPEGRYVLADSGKFDQVSAVTFAAAGDVAVITDTYPGDRYRLLSEIKVV